ncbi:MULTISPECIES: sporulation membrane protein YtaF [Bacillus]|uniref:sporulation membrane protein YtaF n=1 Tax=Bacillus TaxID=1386 RepID=UPI000A17A2E1|nr:sporulation membrane protein YtaF [Bacillus velezensis]ARJ75635.1 sporulation membrane protein YtaF [Bacillus velezensis]MED4626088.1 sporulation membrane protein YtaF [Bacillus velezensis]
MAWLLILGLAVSSSIDNLGVGMSYGIRKIKISHASNMMIAFICFVFSYIGIYFGKWISAVLPGFLPVLLAAFILSVIGIRIILLAVPRKTARVGASGKKGRFAGLMQNPEAADADGSGEIGILESMVLGVAVSANALTNGLSAGLIGLSPAAISITAAVGSFLTIWIGCSLGKKAASLRIGSFHVGQFSTVLSGVIILIIAANTLLF